MGNACLKADVASNKSQSRAFGPLFQLIALKGSKDKRCLVTCSLRGGNILEFGLRSPNGETFSKEYSETELETHIKFRDLHGWSGLLPALKKAFDDSTLSVEFVKSIYTCQIALKTEAGTPAPFKVDYQRQTASDVIHRTLIAPLLSFHSGRLQPNCAEEEPFRSAEHKANTLRAQVGTAQHSADTLQKEVASLKESEGQAQGKAKIAKDRKDEVEQKVRVVQRLCNPLEDPLYCEGDGPVRYALHTPHCSNHTPAMLPTNRCAVALVKAKYHEYTHSSCLDARKKPFSITSLTDPHITQLLSDAPDNQHENIMKVLERVDEWDFDVFSLQEATAGGPLFMVTFALLYKYGLVRHFNMDADVVYNFCRALEAGYHANEYHNAMHAADVTQVLHFIISSGKLIDAIHMTPSDLLACIIAGAMHDFDHPGFNNNFHTRTNSYLATLYNDRSVLENHHCAQVFSLMRDSKFNILSSLSAEQQKDVRDTILEMVLSTDMGNHAKIFQQFKKRLDDQPEWLKRDDQRLAMSIAIKMADISNCSRSQPLYRGWADRIAEEFYCQGEVERRLGLPVSPFMDRQKHKTDFSKGQISFMNYIVIPLFEAGAAFLPELEFTVNKIQDNKAFWQEEVERRANDN